MLMLAAYWWDQDQSQRDVGQPIRNFGDVIAPLIFQHFSGVTVQWAAPESAALIGPGSVMDVLPVQGWAGVVAGSGALHEATTTDLRDATVLGLRGHLSNVQYFGNDVVFGDPLLLASELVAVERETVELGVIPHWSDTTLLDRFAYLNPVFIDPQGDPLDVIRQIGACRKIVSSSLHGVVVADSFGIPRRMEAAPRLLTNKHEGGFFKFQDYASALEVPVGLEHRMTVPKERVNKIKAELFDMLRAVPWALRQTA